MSSATKHDQGKPKMSLIDPIFLMTLARVLQGGEDKYGGPSDPRHWVHGMSYSRVIDAMKRHTLAIEMGQDIDPDSGEPHTAHITACAMILDYYRRHYRGHLDDRRFKNMCGAVQAATPEASIQSITTGEVRLDLPEVLQHQESASPEEATRSVENLQARIANWADRVFPDRTAQNALQKLVMEEIPELLNGGLDDPLEYGDVLILILDVAHLRGIDAVAAAHAKMEINENRHWARDRHTGLMHHIKELEDERHTGKVEHEKTTSVPCPGCRLCDPRFLDEINMDLEP